MIKQGCGRRQESEVWSHFKYDAVVNKTRCIILGAESKQCGKELTGKNPSNMKAHLQREHAVEFEACIKQDTELRNEKKGKAILSYGSSSNSLPQIFLGKGGPSYGASSTEQLAREHDVTSWLIATGLPVRLVDGDEFRRMLNRLDPKFVVPGILCVFIFTMYLLLLRNLSWRRHFKKFTIEKCT